MTTTWILIILFLLGIGSIALFRKDQPLLSYCGFIVSLGSLIVTIIKPSGEFISTKNSGHNAIDATDKGYYVDDNKYLHYGGHKYYAYRSSDIDSFSDAKTFCEENGGYLAIINDEAENRTLYEYVFIDMGYESAYFGLTDEENEGIWKWVDGSALTYENWKDGEPNDLNGVEEYALFYKDEPAWKWNDGDFGKDPPYTGDVIFLIEWNS